VILGRQVTFRVLGGRGADHGDAPRGRLFRSGHLGRGAGGARDAPDRVPVPGGQAR